MPVGIAGGCPISNIIPLSIPGSQCITQLLPSCPLPCNRASPDACLSIPLTCFCFRATRFSLQSVSLSMSPSGSLLYLCSRGSRSSDVEEDGCAIFVDVCCEQEIGYGQAGFPAVLQVYPA